MRKRRQCMPVCEGGLRAGLLETKGLCGGSVESLKNTAADSVCKLVSGSTSPLYLGLCCVFKPTCSSVDRSSFKDRMGELPLDLYNSVKKTQKLTLLILIPFCQ